MAPLIRLRSISRAYRLGSGDVRALDELDLELAPGEFVAVTGASGSGKSTLLQVLGLLDRPTGGRYELAGVDTSKLDEAELSRLRAREIGFVFQFFNLLPTLTAMENVMLPLILEGGRTAQANGRARELLEKVGLDPRGDHLPEELSGGEVQRLAIARALVFRPPILLADEPTGNLDSRTGGAVLDLLRGINREEGSTVVMVTHNREAASYGDRIFYLRDGVLEEGGR